MLDNLSYCKVIVIRDLRGVIEREGAGVGVFLTLTEPSRPMVTEAAGAGQFELPGFAPVPRIQIVTIEQAMALRDRAVRLPARRDDGSRRRRARRMCARRGRWISDRFPPPQPSPPGGGGGQVCKRR